jgi:SAM-dependent methyltransferase
MMATAYGNRRFERFREVAKWIPHQADVLDVCCGDGTLATYIPDSHYHGLDQSSAFIKAGSKKGLNVSLFDLRNDKLPKSQVVVCQISMYQFHPDEEAVLKRLFEVAQDKLIISESVRSLAQSRNPLGRWLGTRFMRTSDMSHSDFRFTPERLQKLFVPYQAYIEYSGSICNGRDWVYVLDKNPPREGVCYPVTHVFSDGGVLGLG